MNESPFDHLISDAMLRQRALEYAIQVMGSTGYDPSEYVRYADVFLAYLQPKSPVPQPLERAA